MRKCVGGCGPYSKWKGIRSSRPRMDGRHFGPFRASLRSRHSRRLLAGPGWVGNHSPRAQPTDTREGPGHIRAGGAGATTSSKLRRSSARMARWKNPSAWIGCCSESGVDWPASAPRGVTSSASSPTSLTCRLSWARLNPDDGFVSPQRGEGFSCYRKILVIWKRLGSERSRVKSQLFVEPQPSDIANRRAGPGGIVRAQIDAQVVAW